MKNILLLSLFISFGTADLSVEQIREMVMKIHEKRAGIDLKTLETTREPFIHLQKEHNTTTFAIPVKEKNTQLVLHAILNGKAYINNEWKSVNETVGGYTLKYIGKRGVVLRSENQIKKVFLYKKRENYITIEGME